MRLFVNSISLALLTAGVFPGPLSLTAQQATGSQTGSSVRSSADAAAQGDELSQQLATEVRGALAAGRFADAEAALVKLSSLQPGVAEIHANLGAVYFQEGKFEAAAASLRQALHLKPTLARSKTLLAMSLAELGQSRQALPELESCFHGTVESEVKRHCGLELLRVYSALHRDAKAVTTALALNEMYPDDGEILYQAGRIYGNFAYLTMEKLRAKAPDSVWMLQASAEARESENKYDEAIESYEAVLRLEPRRPGVHYRMGRVYLARFEATHAAKDQGLAEQQFHEELTLDPDNGNAAYESAQIHYSQGKLEQAQNEFEAITARRPNFEQALVGLGAVLIELQKADMAVLRLKHACEVDSTDEVAWYRLARAYRLAGDLEAQKKSMAEFRRLHAIGGSRLARAGVLTPAGEVTPQQIGATEQP